MDELTAQLAAGFSVSLEPNSTAAPHPRFAQYKSRNVVDQETRRNRILQEQKKQRFDYMNHMRNLSDDVWENTDAESVGSCDSMDIQVDDQQVKLRRPGKYYRNQLMYSEWLVDVPSDFEQEWLTVICPWGKRCLVVASKGRTHAYAKNGYRVNSFSSHLPGGSFIQKGKHRDNCILDCIFNENDGVYYVLDIMCWKNHPVYDSETEFRSFWLTSKFAETPELLEKDTNNPYQFLPLQYLPCTKTVIQQAVNTAAFDIDGLLFYHKRTHYTFGSTPLVMWLKPYMLTEILGIQISEKLEGEKPDSYTTYKAHMEAVAAMKEKAALEKKGSKGKSPKSQKSQIKILQRPMDQSGDYKTIQPTEGNVDPQEPQISSRRKKKQEKDMYRRQYGQDFRMDLMFSEWLTELPDDLEKDWFVVVCPTGKRNIVLAREGYTLSQSKSGVIMDEFSSLLPGGHRSDSCRKEMSVVDTIFNTKHNTFYVLDGLYWNTQVLNDCEAEFRFYWMKERMTEIKGLGKLSRKNEYIFQLLQTNPASVAEIEKALNDSGYEIDGLLFYKKSSIYTAGPTGNALWLKPYMLPDLFPSIKVPECLLNQRPSSFDFAKHKEMVQKEKSGQSESSMRRRVKGRKVNIDKLVDDISQMYITKKQLGGQELTGREMEIMANIYRQQNNARRRSAKEHTAYRGEQPLMYPPSLLGYGRGQGFPEEYDNYHSFNTGYHGYDTGYNRYWMDGYGCGGMMSPPHMGYHDMYGMGSDGFRSWGFTDHSKRGQGGNKSHSSIGRGRGLLDTKTMTAYMLTHNKFKK